MIRGCSTFIKGVRRIGALAPTSNRTGYAVGKKRERCGFEQDKLWAKNADDTRPINTSPVSNPAQIILSIFMEEGWRPEKTEPPKEQNPVE